MPHELAFADAVRPTPVVVLKLPLAEYSLGHELLLLRRRNALMVLAEGEFFKLDYWEQIHAIREAVWLCSDPYGERDRFERPKGFMLGFRWNEWKRRRWVSGLKNLSPLDYALAAAEFRNYLAAARPVIPTAGKHACDVLYPDDGAAKGRSFGQPLVLSLYNFVITLPASERPPCAWDFPFARAMWLFFAKLEAEGNYRIENFEEREEQAVMDEARAEARERKVGAEHRTSNIEPRTPNVEGLATEPPDLGADDGSQMPDAGIPTSGAKGGI